MKQTIWISAGMLLAVAVAATIGIASASVDGGKTPSADSLGTQASSGIQTIPSCCKAGADMDRNGDGLCDMCGISVDRCGPSSCSVTCHG